MHIKQQEGKITPHRLPFKNGAILDYQKARETGQGRDRRETHGVRMFREVLLFRKQPAPLCEVFTDALFAESTVKNNNLNVSIIFRSPFHFHYLFPINRDLAEHNSADKELDGTANVNEEIDGGCVEDRCYAFMKKSSMSACEHPQSRASKPGSCSWHGWVGGGGSVRKRVCFFP